MQQAFTQDNTSTPKSLLEQPFSHVLNEANLRPTLSRIQVLRLFIANPIHSMNIVEVYTALLHAGIRISMATVQRTLSQLELGGILLRNASSGKSSFSLCKR
ncbi:hypothetical protein G7047_11060 [Diaphorobacter sp. HDW4A]|uniref:transcriptional repressor n=1 Tax=Diaphorobacter sp. HDW4A TaxID=2714924 RepID=UPI00140B0A3C|nr:transcriptional repressor [Diaphorobacter sp. HDW4A]QIL80381.1 hypothetical protein G7047_11060 [Diaphorobacter sp. HDW4A]